MRRIHQIPLIPTRINTYVTSKRNNTSAVKFTSSLPVEAHRLRPCFELDIIHCGVQRAPGEDGQEAVRQDTAQATGRGNA